VHKTIFKDIFSDDPNAFCDSVHGHHLSLHIRWESGIGIGKNIHGFGAISAHVQIDPIITRFDLCPRLS
jgi:hypothetical protein